MFSEKEIEKQMKANHCTRQEALEILQWDYEIDHGNTENGALTKEQKALVRKSPMRFMNVPGAVIKKAIHTTMCHQEWASGVASSASALSPNILWQR